jgi:hypothetical protein
MPTRFKIDERASDAMVAVDAMTAPAFRRRGLLTEVVARSHDEWRDAGIAFVIGLPNQQWGSRARALGWRELFPLQWLARPLRPEALIARRLGLPGLGRVHMFGSVWNRFANRRLPGVPISKWPRLKRRARVRRHLGALSQRHRLFGRARCGMDRRRFLSSPTRKYEVLVARRAICRPHG